MSDVFARILNGSNPFEVLGLPVRRLEATVVTRAFRKAALHVHPDKSTDSRAEQAFKVLAHAHEELRSSTRQDELLLRLVRCHKRRRGTEQSSAQPREASTGAAAARHPGRQAGQPGTECNQPAKQGPHTTTYYRTAADIHAAERAARAENKRTRFERQTADLRASVEARMASKAWQGASNTWRGWRPKSRKRATSAAMGVGQDNPTACGPNAAAEDKAAHATAKVLREAHGGRGAAVFSSPLLAADVASCSPRNPTNTRLKPVCLLCRRQFKDSEALHRHEQLSAMHAQKLEEQLITSSGAS